MEETISLLVTVQLEQLAGQFTTGRPLGPWRAKAVGASAQEVLAKIQKRLQRLAVKTLPSTYFQHALPAEHEQWTTSVQLEPEKRGSEWVESITLDLECFRWQLPNGQCVVRIPAVSSVVYGKPEELTEAEVQAQARTALLRRAEGHNLAQLRERFVGRNFEFHAISVEIPVGTQGAQSDSAKLARREEKAKTKTLRSSAADLSNARLSKVFGVDELTQQLAEHFLNEAAQSVLLVGPSGVGKTSMVHNLVYQRERFGLSGRKVWSTSGARIVSGMSGLGMWQERCSKMIREAHETKAILHLGSLFELMEAGRIDGAPGVSAMVRQAIHRGRLAAIAECTPEQLACVEREDPILLRGFNRIEVKEPQDSLVMEILRQAADEQGLNISAQAIEELYRLHARFATYSAMPAAPLRLLSTLTESSTEQNSSAESGSEVELQAHHVAQAFARQTGLPRSLIDDSVALDLQQVDSTLSKNVIGQPEPVDLIVNLIATLKARMVRPGKPLASLMFIGPTGVGKTEMAKAIARLLYSDTQRMIRIDMSEYASPWSTHKLLGKPGEGDGTLTSPIREQPFSVVLLDEFEKADPSVFDLLLQLLGEGRLTDAQGRLADFRNAVVIMTSNLGAETFREQGVGFNEADRSAWREHFYKEVRSFVRPELLGRIDRIVPFGPLPLSVVRQIASRELEKVQARAGLKFRDCELEVAAEALEKISTLGYQPQYGARPLRRAIEEYITIPLADELSRRQRDSRWRFKVTFDEDEFRIETEKLSTKTGSVKEQEAAVIDQWQQLGIMARLALVSPPMRSLENEAERTRRNNVHLRTQLEAAASPSRAARLKQKLKSGEELVETYRYLKSRLEEVSGRISRAQLDLLLPWYRNEIVDWEQRQQQAQTLLTELRQATDDMLSSKVNPSDHVTLMAVGGKSEQLNILWRAYLQLADQHHWGVDAFAVQQYDPRRDPETEEYRKLASERRAHVPDRVPEFSIRQSNSDDASPAAKICDVFRVMDPRSFDGSWEDYDGFLIEFRGKGVLNWLENEHGLVHFFDPRQVGKKRRVRVKVGTSQERVTKELVLSTDWLEMVAPADRDPRRVFVLNERQIQGADGLTVRYPQGKPSTGMANLIAQEHEVSLWRSIGFQGVPHEAKLSYQSPGLD